MPGAVQPKRDLILGAARRLLIRRGFRDVVLDDVAREAGVAKGTLFLHFKNKDELIAAAFADLVDRLGQSLEHAAASGRRGEALLEAAVHAVLSHFERNRDFMAHFGAGSFPGCGERSCGMLRERMARNMRRMIHILGLSRLKPAAEPKNLEYAAVALFGLCRSAVLHRVLTGDRRPLMARAPKVMEMFLYGIKGRP